FPLTRETASKANIIPRRRYASHFWPQLRCRAGRSCGQLAKDEAIAEAETVLLTVPNQLSVDYNVHVVEAILKMSPLGSAGADAYRGARREFHRLYGAHGSTFVRARHSFSSYEGRPRIGASSNHLSLGNRLARCLCGQTFCGRLPAPGLRPKAESESILALAMRTVSRRHSPASRLPLTRILLFSKADAVFLLP